MLYSTTLYVDEKSYKVLHKKRLFMIGKKKLYKLPLICIYFPENGNRPEYTLLENLRYDYYKRHLPRAVGFAENEASATDIVTYLIGHVYETDPKLDYRGFFEENYGFTNHFSEVKAFAEIKKKSGKENKNEEDEFIFSVLMKEERG